jgi:phospholipid/cholesterol/gamma-HCH transport system substrate-binding protein
LINDQQTKDSLEESVVGASDFLQTFTRLHALVTIASEYKGENANTNLLGGFRSYINVRLQPRPDKFYEIESADDTGGVDRFTTEQTLDPETGEVQTIEKLTRTDDFKFSFQMGLRWRNITFRAGIKDNTGGLGLDLHLLNNRLEIRNDFFEFASSLFALEVPRAPRWRLLASTPLPMAGFYLVGGIDELLNSPRSELGVHQRTWFMGIQFRFDDTDLRALLGF